MEKLHTERILETLVSDRRFLLGDRPYLCDFALASQLVYLTRAATMREILSNRPNTRAWLSRLPHVRV